MSFDKFVRRVKDNQSSVVYCEFCIKAIRKFY